jgi:hypothetical protein
VELPVTTRNFIQNNPSQDEVAKPFKRAGWRKIQNSKIFLDFEF